MARLLAATRRKRHQIKLTMIRAAGSLDKSPAFASVRRSLRVQHIFKRGDNGG